MTLQYEVKVIGLETDGHPHQLLYSSFDVACGVYDQLCKKYPKYEIQLNQNQLKTLKIREAPPAVILVPTQCPKGHSGEADGKSILKLGGNGNWVCGVCGEIWEERK